MWNDLVTTALIGTERRALSLENTPAPFDELATQLSGQPPERALLALAGAMTLYRRVGQTVPSTDTPLLEPCDLDDLPPCSPRAGLYLQQMLALPVHAPSLQEWITAAARAQQRVSDEYLPRLLIAFERHPTLPDHFYDVLGKRGRWLAQQNPGWAYAVLPQHDAEWQIANYPARQQYLRQLRASDPAHARALVESVWRHESSDDRWRQLETFELNLSRDDEAFLEAALDDRARFVQYVAATLLAKLSDSAYCQRMIERAQQFIQIHWQQQVIGRNLVIDLTLPESFDDSMKRDDLKLFLPSPWKLGERAYWLFKIAAALPMSFWLGGDWSAHELVQAAHDTGEWSQPLIEALAKAARNHQSYALAEAILDIHAEAGAIALKASRPAAREAYALRMLERERQFRDLKSYRVLQDLCEIGHDWSAHLTRSVVSTTASILPRMSAADVIFMGSTLVTSVMKMPLECVEDLRALVRVENKSKSTWNHAVKQTTSTLELRRNMLKEFGQ